MVSGGGSGIGLDVARQLLGLGANVVIASRDEVKLRAAARGLAADLPAESAPRVDYQRCNIRDQDDVARLMAYAVSEFGQIDCLVNNGGGQFPCAAEAISDKGWDAVLDTNLTGTFRMCREAVTTQGGLRETGGSIVNVICLHEQGFPSMAHTGAARAGVNNLTKSLAVEWANYGIRVNAVAPGIIFSETAEANYNKSKNGDDTSTRGTSVFSQMLSSKAPVIPFRRLGTVREVSNAICFLLGQSSSYISGSCLEVDGGLSCAGATGSDMFLRKPCLGRSVREAFPVEGDELLPDFCVADDDRVQVVVNASDTSGDGQDQPPHGHCPDHVLEQIRELEAKLAALRAKSPPP